MYRSILSTGYMYHSIESSSSLSEKSSRKIMKIVLNFLMKCFGWYMRLIDMIRSSWFYSTNRAKTIMQNGYYRRAVLVSVKIYYALLVAFSKRSTCRIGTDWFWPAQIVLGFLLSLDFINKLKSFIFTFVQC